MHPITIPRKPFISEMIFCFSYTALALTFSAVPSSQFVRMLGSTDAPTNASKENEK